MSEIADILKRTANGVMADIRSEWGHFPRDTGNAEISFRITKDEAEEVCGEYTAKGQKMWLLEHGSGSKMDDEQENPGLAEYKQSGSWNPERGKPPGNDPSGHEIRSRGPYYDLDGNFHEGSSMAMPHGLNLEWETAGHGKPWAKVAPRKGNHIVRDNVAPKEGTSARMTAMEDEIAFALGNMIDSEVRRGKN